MKRKTLAVGITLLFIVSVISPLVFGNNVKIKDTVQISELEDPPGIEWSKIFGGRENDHIRSVKQTLDGGYIFTGWTQNIIFGINQYEDAWLVKTDIYGNVEWEKTFGKPGSLKIDTGDDVALTSDGGYVLTGTSRSYNDDEIMEVLLIKTDENGDEQWIKTYGYGRGFSVQQTSDSGYIVSGDTGVTLPTIGLLLKTDNNGNEVWRKTSWGFPGETHIWDVCHTSDGGYIASCSINYDNVTYENDLSLVKVNSTGGEQWKKIFGGPDIGTNGDSVMQTSDGGYIVGGSKKPGDDKEPCAWLLKTDSDGNEQWNSTFHNSVPRCTYVGIDAQQTSDGGYVIAGWIDNAPGEDYYDSFLIKTDTSGNKQWEMNFEEHQTLDEMIHSVQQTADGGYILAGDEGYDSNGFVIKVGETVSHVNITRPSKGLYLFNFMVLPFQNRLPFIIGPINIEVDVSDDVYDIEKVEFIVDKKLMATDTTMPYSYLWIKPVFLSYYQLKHTIAVVAFNSDKHGGFDEIEVQKFF